MSVFYSRWQKGDLKCYETRYKEVVAYIYSIFYARGYPQIFADTKEWLHLNDDKRNIY